MDNLIIVLQGLVGVILGAGAFTFRTLFLRLDRNEGRLNALEVEMAKNMEQHRSIFLRLSTIEEKIDRLLDNR